MTSGITAAIARANAFRPALITMSVLHTLQSLTMPAAGPDEETETYADSERVGPLRLVAMWNGGSLVHDLAPNTSVVIGRGGDADVRVEHASVSRRHAIVHVASGVRVEDLGSSNGTFVDGRRLPPNGSAPLRAGALLEIGAVLLAVRGGEGPTSAPSSPGVLVRDPEMVRVHELVTLVAKSALSVILLGETGSGKEVISTRIHQLSPRASRPFMKINCAALVESLLEAELFGYEKGAFTGAVAAKAGLFESAHGGTVFLDELGEMPLSTQAKLLRVLESGEVTRVGAVKPRPIDVRFVSATNRDLKSEADAGRFRRDLFFRLDGVSIRVPPLRERVGEIAMLATEFVAAACASAGRPPIPLADDAIASLVSYGWPGNIRELRNVMNRSVILCQGRAITAADLRYDALGRETGSVPPPPLSAPPPPPTVPASRPDRDAERKRISDALEQCVGNQTRAAKLLGISRRTLIKKLDAYGFPRPRTRDDDDE
jgi:DNA-binding NtrC family response regulator